MSKESNQPNPNIDKPSLGDVLQLLNTIERIPEKYTDPASYPYLPGAKGSRDTSESTRIAVMTYPDGEETDEGTMISHIGFSQLTPSGDYGSIMNYMILRDGEDETTTRIIKRPPFEIPSEEDTYQGHEPTSPEGSSAAAEAMERVEANLGKYTIAKETGLFEPTSNEVQELTQTISTHFISDDVK